MDIKQTLGASTFAVLTLVTPGNAQYEAPERPITLVGCVQQESEYRRHHARGPGGPLQSGLGRGNDYVLVDAIEIQPGQALPAGTDLSCTASLGGRAYEMKGSNESSLRAFVGRRIEVTGIRQKAEVRTPEGQPTGGITGGPQNFDLEVFEVSVASFREPTVAEAPRAAIATVREMEVPPQVTPTPAPAEPEPVATAGVQARAALPKTATPLPFTGLLGLLSVAAALGLRLARRS